MSTYARSAAPRTKSLPLRLTIPIWTGRRRQSLKGGLAKLRRPTPLTGAYVGNARFRAHVNSLGISTIQRPAFAAATQLLPISAEMQEALEINYHSSECLWNPRPFRHRWSLRLRPAARCVLNPGGVARHGRPARSDRGTLSLRSDRIFTPSFQTTVKRFEATSQLCQGATNRLPHRLRPIGSGQRPMPGGTRLDHATLIAYTELAPTVDVAEVDLHSVSLLPNLFRNLFTSPRTNWITCVSTATFLSLLI